MWRGMGNYRTGHDWDLLSRGLERENTPHDSRASRRLIILQGMFIPALAFSLFTGKSVFIFGYIMACAFAFNGPLHHNRPWSELGIKRGFVNDLKRVWHYVGIEAVLFQILSPTLLIAAIFGFYPQLVQHVVGRVALDFSSIGGLSSLGILLVAIAILTLLEDIVFRATIQEWSSWFIRAPFAILFAAILFSLCHAVGVSGSPEVMFMDVLGVFIDGVLLGIIYSMTHNLAVTWATHYIGDVIGLLVIGIIL